VIPATCPCCEVLHPPHRDGCTFEHDCPNEAAIFDEMSSLRAEIARLREERRCVWTDYDGSRDFDTACGEKHSILTGLELYDYCPFCGGLVKQQDACDQEEDEPLPPGPEGDG
jgi:hypothetical protein